MTQPLSVTPLMLAGACNCRDFGGYMVADGPIISGRLVRGAQLSTLTTEGVRTLESLPLGQIIDLRGEQERLRQPNRVLGAPTVIIDILHEVVGRFNASPIDMVARATPQEAAALLPDIYRAFVTEESCRRTWRQFIDTLLTAPPGAIYFHCTAGKDRTGFAAALILLLLGASNELIMADYLYSNTARREENQRLLTELCHVMPDKDPALVQMLLEVKADYLLASFASMTALFGGADGFISKGLGVTSAERERIATRLMG